MTVSLMGWMSGSSGVVLRGWVAYGGGRGVAALDPKEVGKRPRTNVSRVPNSYVSGGCVWSTSKNTKVVVRWRADSRQDDTNSFCITQGIMSYYGFVSEILAFLNISKQSRRCVSYRIVDARLKGAH